MLQVRIHGRGGQGVVTAAEMLSVAAFLDGRHAQAFPSFGSERMGAPVTAYCRIDDRPIRTRDPISEPDALLVQDPTLLHDPTLLDGLVAGGLVLVNTAKAPSQLRNAGRPMPAGTVTVAATDIARLAIGRPVPNTALLGAYAALSGGVTLDALGAAIRRRFPGAIGERNVDAAGQAATAVAGAGVVTRA